MTTAAGAPPLLVHQLARWAAERPERTCLTFLRDDGAEDLSLGYGELYRRAAALAAALVRAGAGGAPVLLCVEGGTFAVAFCACLLSGTIAVPLPAVAAKRMHERLDGVIADSGAAAAIIPVASPMAGELARRGLRLLDPAGIATGGGAPAWPGAEAPALLQYTSGSTGTPKGVVITHANLAHGSALIGAAFRTADDDVAVSWLPLHHDMGLVGSLAHILDRGLHCVHMSPRAMIARPVQWLRTIARYRATVSGGPDFAYRLLVERTRTAEVQGLDLSRWRIAYSGAEPVRPATLQRTADLLAGTGFSPRAFLPCYGLAEATLIVSGGPPGTGFDLAHPDGQPASTYVSCGASAAERAIAIVDPETGSPCPDGTIGEIAITGRHVSPGYWRRGAPPDAGGRIAIAGDGRTWYRTGDLGFLRGDALHVSGRIKDLLIINGVKHHAEDVEGTIQALVPACAQGAVAAVQCADGDGTSTVVAIELRNPAADIGEVAREISAAVWCRHGIRIDRVVPSRTGMLPRTTSGKIRRSAIRARIEQEHGGAVETAP